MLKALTYSLILLASTLAIVGCNKSKSDNNATSTQCLQDPYYGGCNNSVYNNYYGYGYQSYPYGGMPGYTSDPNSIYRYQLNNYYTNSYGAGNYQLCSCPSGTRPVYNGNWGIGCAAQSAIPQYAPVYYWSWSANNTANNQYVNWGQVSNINPSVNSNSGCYSNVAWSCLVGQVNQCPSGSTCQATAQNAPIGVCIRQ